MHICFKVVSATGKVTKRHSDCITFRWLEVVKGCTSSTGGILNCELDEPWSRFSTVVFIKQFKSRVWSKNRWILKEVIRKCRKQRFLQFICNHWYKWNHNKNNITFMNDYCYVPTNKKICWSLGVIIASRGKNCNTDRLLTCFSMWVIYCTWWVL